MELLKHRGLAIGCLGYFILLYASYYIHIAITLSIAALGISFLVFLAIRYKITKGKWEKSTFIKLAPLCILLALAALISLFVFERDKKMLNLCDDTEMIVEGKVDSVVFSSDHFGSYIVDITSVNNESKKLKVVARDSLGALKENDVFIARSSFTISDFTYYRENGIFIDCDISELISVSAGKKDPFDYLKIANKYLDGIFKKELNSDTYPIVSALFLGNRSGLDPSIERDYARIGISHILSLGGMHVSIIITIIGFVIFNFIKARRIQIILMCISVFCFVGISGFSGPALRAGLMQIIFLLLHFMWRRSDSVSTLFFSIFIVCLINPYSVFSISLILSFLAMLGCMISSRYIRKRRHIFKKVKGKLPRFLLLTFITTTFVLFITIPITSLRFGTFSYLTYISNMVIVPFINILIYLAPLVLILSPIPYISDGISFICEWLTYGITKVCEFVSSIPSIVIPVKNIIQIIGTLLLLLSVILIIVVSKKHIKHAYYTAILGVFLFVLGSIILPISRINSYQITTICGDYGDTVLVESENKLIAIDMTTYSKSEMNPYIHMSKLGYGEIHTYIACDYGYKMSSYIDELTGSALIRNVYLPTPVTEKEQKYLKEVSKILEKRGVSYALYEKELDISNIELSFADKVHSGNSTKRSVCFSMLINKTRYTYLGASSYELPSYFASDYVNSSDIVAFGSYGPNRSMTFNYPVSNIDYFIYLGSSYDYASDEIKEASLGKEIFNDSSLIKIRKNR